MGSPPVERGHRHWATFVVLVRTGSIDGQHSWSPDKGKDNIKTQYLRDSVLGELTKASGPSCHHL
jgi:hypothetical protein